MSAAIMTGKLFLPPAQKSQETSCCCQRPSTPPPTLRSYCKVTRFKTAYNILSAPLHSRVQASCWVMSCRNDSSVDMDCWRGRHPPRDTKKWQQSAQDPHFLMPPSPMHLDRAQNTFSSLTFSSPISNDLRLFVTTCSSSSNSLILLENKSIQKHTMPLLFKHGQTLASHVSTVNAWKSFQTTTEYFSFQMFFAGLVQILRTYQWLCCWT